MEGQLNTAFEIDRIDNEGRNEPAVLPVSGPKEKTAVVTVRNAKKSYGNGAQVLNGFNMTVEKGTIYGLLGSSGCGKTTILSCIVGVRELDCGSILVFGNEPGRKSSRLIGYMPQDISLYEDFTIEETLTYFGSLYCIDKDIIKRNMESLVELLKLPELSRRVGTLSGGQRRRVSTCVAMIHDPPLLILDEPTVGVDPLLRESIWNHLVDRVKNHGTTVIITTHYIEEARQSNRIGLMRNGKLLAEKCPDDLLEEHEATLLEDVVLKLCLQDKSDNNTSLTDISVPRAESPTTTTTPEESLPVPIMTKHTDLSVDEDDKIKTSLKRIYALGLKNARVLLRNYLLLIFMLWIPAAEVLFMCIAIGNDPKPMKFGVVNDELDSLKMKSCEELLQNRSSFNDDCSAPGLSCVFMNFLPKNVIYLYNYSDSDEARKAVKNGDIWGFMSFPEQFSGDYYLKVVDSSLATEDVLNGSTIYFEMDETSKQISAALKKQFADSLKDFTEDLMIKCDHPEKNVEDPLSIGKPIYGREDTDTREFMSAGVLIAILFFFPLITVAIQYIYEKKLGTLERALVAGVSTWELMAAFSITTTMILLIQTMLALGITTLLFQIPVQGSFLLCIVLGILVGLAGVSMGFIVGLVCREEVEATMLSIAMFLPVVMLSGVMWPLEGMPKAFQYFSYLLPTQMTSEALRSIISRGWTFSHLKVWPGFVTSLGWICVYWIITVCLHKKGWTR